MVYRLVQVEESLYFVSILFNFIYLCLIRICVVRNLKRVSGYTVPILVSQPLNSSPWRQPLLDYVLCSLLEKGENVFV